MFLKPSGYAYNKETADIVSLDLSENFVSVISGAARTGRTNALKILVGSAKLKGGKVVLIDKSDNGNASDTFRKTFSKKKADVDKMVKAVNSYANDLNQIASVYTGVEKANVQIAEALASDVII